MSVTKEQWIQALRSSQFKQGKNYLRDKDNNYCCLGVLCELKNYNKTYDICDEYYKYDGCFAKLPEELFGIGQLGDIDADKLTDKGKVLITELYEKYGLSSLRYTLTYLNDSGATFEEIADLLEEYEE